MRWGNTPPSRPKDSHMPNPTQDQLNEPVAPTPGTAVEQLRAASATLLAEADRLESVECSGVTAVWCATCGNCTCPDDALGRFARDCPLHAPESPHAEAEIAASL